MSYLALYRKYRSTNFEEVYGQKTIIQTLKNALKENKIAHAYLFSGPRGTGKTSIARLFAKALNCEENIGEICNSCSNCIEISEGSSPDVIEIDAASNSGVDEVRNLIDKVKYAPTKSRYKVYIIDEVHMMSNSAFNALLKTLEEPPSYVVFILCTTELYKVLPTIVSRCQRYEFKKLSDEELTSLLKNVLSKENINYEEEAISEIVELSNGGARDALSILDQTISFSGTSLHAKDIESLFGLTTKKEKITLLEFIKNKDSKGLLKLYDTLINRNIDLVRFTNELLSLLKDALIAKKLNNDKNIYLSLINKYFNEEEENNMIQILLDLLKEFRISNNPSLLFELSLLKIIEENDLTSKRKEAPQEKIIIKEITKEVPVVKEIIKEKENSEVTTSSIINDISKLSPLFKEEKKSVLSKSNIVKDGETNKLNTENLIKLTVISNKEAKRELMGRWKILQAFIKDEELGDFASLLLEGTPYLLTDKILILSYNYSAKAKLINIKANQEKLAECLEKISGKILSVYALDRIESTNLVTTYRNLEEIKKLPKSKDIDSDEIKFE